MTFNYSHVEKSMLGNPIVLASKVQELMGQGKSGGLEKGNLKNGYWLVEMKKISRSILAFRVPGVGQVCQTRMPQGLESLGHHFHKLGYIAFSAIPEPNLEPNLIGKSFRVYVDSMFMKHKGFWD